jgi:methylglutaconyl-CoA hydratase
VAGGCGLATACDLVVAEPGARFGYTEVKIGFLAAMVLTFLTRRLPGHVARRLLLDPEMIDGERAVAIGLADELAAGGEALATAVVLARKVCAKASPSALAATKALLNDVVGRDWRHALETAAEANVRQRRHPDCRRGVRSFLDTKTTPDWLAPDDDNPE